MRKVTEWLRSETYKDRAWALSLVRLIRIIRTSKCTGMRGRTLFVRRIRVPSPSCFCFDMASTYFRVRPLPLLWSTLSDHEFLDNKKRPAKQDVFEVSFYTRQTRCYIRLWSMERNYIVHSWC